MIYIVISEKEDKKDWIKTTTLEVAAQKVYAQSTTENLLDDSFVSEICVPITFYNSLKKENEELKKRLSDIKEITERIII